MKTIKIKPFSINKAWQGRRFKTPEYKQWRIDFSLLCGKGKMIKGLVDVNLKFYLKNFAMIDVDNCVKTTLDSLVENGFIEDDRKIVKLAVEKIKSKDEKIEFEILKK